jgi:hypothetical protein
MLRTMLTLTSSREALIVGNQMPAVSSLLSCALMRDERKTAVSCLHLLNQLLAGTSRGKIDAIQWRSIRCWPPMPSIYSAPHFSND